MQFKYKGRTCSHSKDTNVLDTNQCGFFYVTLKIYKLLHVYIFTAIKCQYVWMKTTKYKTYSLFKSQNTRKQLELHENCLMFCVDATQHTAKIQKKKKRMLFL